MRGENGTPQTPDWKPRRCTCTCLCAGIEEWAARARDHCGCCYTDCGGCLHDRPNEAGPLLWQGDQA